MNGESGMKFIDNPHLGEIFADQVTAVSFDGANVRIELSVGRADGPRSGESQATAIHPVARLVVPLVTINELLGRTNGLLGELERRGILRKDNPAGSRN